jgi:hypothetical protein
MIAALSAELWPYAIVLILGALPNEIWRLAGLFAVQGLREDAEILVWVRFIAIGLVASVVAQLLAAPSGSLAIVPAWIRIGAIVAAILAYAISGRRVLVGLLIGLATLIGAELLR